MSRLVTHLDIAAEESADVQISARLELEIGSASTPLLTDRGWGLSGIEWSALTVEEVEKEARVVVGPDEPFGDRTEKDMQRDHWLHLASVAAQQGVSIAVSDLSRLPHDVVLSQRLIARLWHGQDSDRPFD